MLSINDITTVEIEGTTFSAITFGEKEQKIPNYLLQGEKKKSYLYHDGKLTPWYWKGFNNVGDKHCVYFEKIEGLHPVADLATTLRNKAPMYIEKLSKALSLCPHDFLQLEGGIISSWRIFFTERGDVLLTSLELADILSSDAPTEDRFNNSLGWIHSDIHKPFTLIDQMAQIYYYAITGFMPFAREDVRETGFTIIPLKLIKNVLAPNLDEELANHIDGILTLSLGKQRAIAGNLDPEKALVWFHKRFSDITWDLEKRETLPDSQKLMEEDPTVQTVLRYKGKQAQRSIFWRHKGSMIMIIGIAVLLVGGFAYSRIKQALAPPYTAGMSPEEIIEEYYKSQNDLDSIKLTASFANGVKSPIDNEVSTLFVNRQTRMAYEHVSSIINPETWNDEGEPPIRESFMIYGVDDLQIQDAGNGVYVATTTLYSPDNYLSASDSDAEVMPPEGYTYSYVYKQQQTFVINMSKKGWYLIEDIHQDSAEYQYTLQIPTVKNKTEAAQLSNGTTGGTLPTTTQTADTDERKVIVIHDKKLQQNSQNLLDGVE